MIMRHGPWIEKLDLKHNLHFATPCCYKWRHFILAICDVSTGKCYLVLYQKALTLTFNSSEVLLITGLQVLQSP